MLYVQALATDPGGFVDALVTMLLPLAAGWLALIVLLVGETDEAFANIYSTAVSIQNLLSKVKLAVLAAAVGLVAMLAAVSLNLMGYETFLLLIGGAFVPVFGIFLADYFLVRRRAYDIEELYRESGSYWYGLGLSPLGLGVWLAGFLLYCFAAQPPWLVEHADFMTWAPGWVTHIGGTIPALLFSFAAYWAGARAWLGVGVAKPAPTAAAAEGR
jgi:purine-cytosine permease-like protein